MHNVRRYLKKGNIYFLTHVTYLRNPILVEHIDLLWEAIEKQRTKNDFDLIAWVIIPDHMHVLIDPMSNDLPILTKNIKLSFAANLRSRLGLQAGRTWQNRYWDHVIRDRTDLNNHIDYIHYNPVKHRLVPRPGDYRQTSFHDFLKRGEYDEEWGCHNAPDFGGGFGE